MNILDKESENSLKIIIEKSKKENEKPFIINGTEFSPAIIKQLHNLGYIKILQDTSETDMFIVLIELTRIGKTYFIDKKKFNKSKVKHNVIEWIKFLIPVIISIIALIISIA